MKKLLSLCLAVAMAFTLVACGGSQGDTTKPSADKESSTTEPVIIKLTHPAPEAHPWHEAALKFEKDVEARTNGGIDVQVFPNHTLAPLREAVEGLQNGSIEMGLITTSSMTTVAPSVQIFDLPYLFPTQEIADTILDSELGKEAVAELEASGFKICSFIDFGYRCITNSKRPITSPADMKNLQFRAPEMPMLVSWLSSMGSTPVVIAGSELFSALQQKVCDGQDNGVVTVESGKYYEAQDYMTETNHILAVAVTVFNADFFNGLSAEYQQILQEESTNLSTYSRELMAASVDTSREICKEAGMEFYELSNDELQAFIDSGRAVWSEFYDQIDTDLLDRISAKVDELMAG